MNEDTYPTTKDIKSMQRFFEAKYDKVLHPWQVEPPKAPPENIYPIIR